MAGQLHALIFKRPETAPDGLGHLPEEVTARNHKRRLVRAIYLRTRLAITQMQVRGGRWHALVGGTWVDTTDLLRTNPDWPVVMCHASLIMQSHDKLLRELAAVGWLANERPQHAMRLRINERRRFLGLCNSLTEGPDHA